MFFIKFFYFLSGYVIIEAEGLFLERFINLCVRRSISFKIIKKDRTRLILSISFADFKKMRAPALKSKTHIRILKKCGLPSLIKRYRRRYAFFIGAALFILFFAISSQFVWEIEILGADHIKKTDILSVLKTEGVKIGMPKRNMSSAREIKDTLMREFPEISWAWVYTEGTRVKLQINEGILPPTIIDKSVPCDVIAVREGIIKSVTAKQGIVFAEENTAVMPGDVLIAGTIPQKDGGFKTVHAQGDVYALTSHTKKGSYMVSNEHRIPTGEKKTSFTLNLFSKSITLGKNAFSEFDINKRQYDLKISDKFYLGISLVRTDYIEVTPISEQIPYDSAVLFASEDLEQQIAKKLLPGAVMQSREVLVNQIDERTIEVTLTMAFLEKIGTSKQINTNGETKNDSTQNGN